MLCAAGLEEVEGNITGGGVQSQGLKSPDALARQARDVSVSMELPEQRLGVPQLQYRLRPGQCGMCGEQRAALGVFAGRLGGPAGQRQHLVRAGQLVDPCPPQGFARRGVPSVQHLLWCRCVPRPVDRLPYESGG